MKNPFGIKERKCKKSDYPFYRNLIRLTIKQHIESYRPFTYEKVHERFIGTYPEIKVLMKGKRRIGIYQIRPHGKKLEIVRIFLMPSYQRKKIGIWYMKQFETLGYKTLILEVWDNNPARFFYKKLGYKTTGKKNHKISMEKKIS